MRRRTDTAWLLSACLWAAGTLGFVQQAAGQTPSATEGALEFLLPIGARAVGMGQAVAASAVGSDAVWWNPALIARGPREVALHVSQTFATQSGTDAAGAFVYFVPKIGAIGLSLRYLTTGEQSAGDTPDQSGTFVPSSTIAGASFGAPFGDRLAIGVTAKLLQIKLDCTGACTTSSSASTGALDLGAQYITTKDSLVAIGAAIRNLGFKLQINDAPQADALPNRADFGVAVSPRFRALPAEVRLRTAVDLVTRLSGGGAPGYRLGAEVAYREKYQGRVGYVVNGPTGTGSGLAFGLGVSTGRLQIDFARSMSDPASEAAGVTPTFISLRYRF